MSKSKKLRVAVYARVSTAQDSQKLSFENQKLYYEKYVNSNPNWNLCKIYADKGVSGTLLGKKREQFNQLMSDCGLKVVDTKKEFSVIETETPSLYDLIIVKDEKRFSRNTDINSVIKKLKNKGVGVFFETLGINTLEKDDITLKILFAMSEDFSKNLSKNLKISYERAHLKNPKVLGHYPPFGYQFSQNENGERTLTPINESYVKIINDIFNKYISGEGYRVIAKYVNEQGFTTCQGKAIQKYTVERILKNEKYCGYIQVLRQTPETINTYGHILRKHMNYDLIKSDKVIPIVSEEIWKKANDKLKSKPISKNSRGINYKKSKYANRVLCMNCLRMYNKTKDSNGIPVYVCSTKREKLGNAENCKSPYISEDFLDNYLDELLKDETFINTEKERVQDIINYLYYYKYTLVATFFMERDNSLIDNLKSQIKDFKEQQDYILNQFGELPKEVLIRKINSIEEEITELQKQLDKEEFSFQNFKTDIQMIDTGMNQLKSYKFDKVKTHSDLLEVILIQVIPNSPNSEIRQKRNDCTLSFRSLYADEYQDIEYSLYNKLSLSPAPKYADRLSEEQPFTDEEIAQLDKQLEGIF